jgi:hypothetical protein
MGNIHDNTLTTSIVNEPHIQYGQPRSVVCEVIFGSPNLDCRGTGVCKIMDHLERRPDPSEKCRRTPAFISAGQHKNLVVLRLIREFVCLNVYKNHLRKGFLEMEAPCLIPDSLVQTLGLSRNILEPGRYTIRESGGFILIQIGLSASPHL